MLGSMPATVPARREEYAEATRRAIWTRRAAFPRAGTLFHQDRRRRHTGARVLRDYPQARVCCATTHRRASAARIFMGSPAASKGSGTLWWTFGPERPSFLPRATASTWTILPQSFGRSRLHVAICGRGSATLCACCSPPRRTTSGGRVFGRGDREISSGARGDRDDWRICTPCARAWKSSRRLTSCGFISAILASSLCATRTTGATNAQNDGSTARANWALLRNPPLCWSSQKGRRMREPSSANRVRHLATFAPPPSIRKIRAGEEAGGIRPERIDCRWTDHIMRPGSWQIGCAILLASPREAPSHERIPARFAERRVEVDGRFGHLVRGRQRRTDAAPDADLRIEI